MNQANAVIDQLIQWAENQPAVRAMLLTSTRAIPNAPVDRFSDYDLILVVPDIQPFFEDRRWLQDFGQVLVGYWDQVHPEPIYGIEYFSNVIQYEDGLKIDFTLWPIELLRRIVADPGLPAELDAGYSVLIDKEHLTEKLQAPTYRAYIPAPPTAEIFQRMVEEFFSDAPYVAKCLWRDELLPAKWCLDYDMKHVYLRPLLEWRVELAHAWSVKIGALGKGLKKRLPATVWAQLEDSYAGAEIDDNWDALFKTIDLFRQVAIEIADHLGYTYPHDLDQRVTAYVQKMQQMS
ncbi:aminoglycoside 6-adenylyltransferase [soil metagenome]